MGSQKSQRDMVGFLNKTDVRPVISDTFKLENLGEAFQFQMDNKHFGKISIEV
jgi:NADPH:quinone reductase-like Zn-dependent oxidoreductase